MAISHQLCRILVIVRKKTKKKSLHAPVQPQNANAFNECGWTPLLTAANRKSLAEVQALVTKGADVNIADQDGFTPLMSAVVEGRKEIAIFLIQCGAVVDAVDTYGHTALSWAVTKGDFEETAQVLIDAGANVNKADFGEFTPLMRAALMDHPRCFALLLAQGADVKPVNTSWHKTALEMALERGSEKLKELARAVRR